MLDIAFDIETREIMMAGNDFATTDNPSQQNGGILWASRCAIVGAPMFGIGPEELINSDGGALAFEANRWKAAALLDGATLARWSGGIVNGEADVVMEISYL